MTIQFDCDHCGTTLRTHDSKAGKWLKCPKCLEVLTIPPPDLLADDEFEVIAAPTKQQPENATPTPADLISGAEISNNAVESPACSENPFRAPENDLETGSGQKRSISGRRVNAGLAKRFLGVLVDYLAMIVFFGPVCFTQSFLYVMGDDAQYDDAILAILLLLCGSASFLGLNLYLMIKRGQSIGKYFVGTHVRDVTTNANASFVRIVALRSLFSGLFSAIPGVVLYLVLMWSVFSGVRLWSLSFVPVVQSLSLVIPVAVLSYALFDTTRIFRKDRRCWHDVIAGTYVYGLGTACPKCGKEMSAGDTECPECAEGLKVAKTTSHRKNAGTGQQFLGALVDTVATCLFVLPPWWVARFPLLQSLPSSHVPGRNGVIVLSVTLVFGVLPLLVINLILMIRRGQSVGKYVVGTQVRDIETNAKAQFRQIFVLRSLINNLISMIPLVGWVYAICDACMVFNAERRCQHDLIAGTYVAEYDPSA